MEDHYNKIRELSVDEVLGDPVALRSLLILASALLLGGGQPAICNSCLRDYYYQIVNNYEKLNKNYQTMKNRTCKPKWVGVKYVKGALYDSETITDEQALSALKNGYLTEKDFEKLPEEPKDDTIELIEETKPKQTKPQVKKNSK
jgi:hypothetical protein